LPEEPASLEEAILETDDGSIAWSGSMLVCTCERRDFDLPLRGVAIFATVVGVIVTGIVGAGFAPRLLLMIAFVWFSGAGIGFWVLARRGREFGRFEIDPAKAELRHLRGDRLLRARSLDEVAGYAALRDTIGTGTSGADERYDVVPRWLVLIFRGGGRARLGRGRPWQLGRALRALDEVGIRAISPGGNEAPGARP
jgi:hypothetical protein